MPMDDGSLTAVESALRSAGGSSYSLLGGSGVGQGVLGLLLCLLSSVPLAHLSKKAASLLAVLLTAVAALVRRLLLRRALSSESEREQMAFEDAHGKRHEVVFLGDPGVGKSSLIAALRGHVPPSLREVDTRSRIVLSSSDGKSAASAQQSEGAAGVRSAGVRRHAVIVWTSSLPEPMRGWSHTWQTHHPGWEFTLWNDTENRDFIASEYAWFLPYYDEYNENIKRVDAVRVFLMYHFGGVYADLDFLSLRNLQPLLDQNDDVDVILGQMGRDPSFHDSIPNALMISKPRASFWLQVMRELVRRVNCNTPMFDTGPTMLTDVARAQHAGARVRILPADFFYPINWASPAWRQVPRCSRAKLRTYADILALNRTTKVLDGSMADSAYAITVWSHSWEPGSC